MTPRPYDPKNRMKVTTQIYIQREGVNGFEHLGNILEFKDASPNESVDHKTATSAGVLVVDDSQTHTIGRKYQFKFDDLSKANLRRLLRSLAPSSTTQASNASLAVSISSPVKGCSYFLGARNLNSHSLTFDGDAKVEGSDYIVDKKSGMLTILESGTIVSGDAVAGTVNCPELDYGTFRTNAEVDLIVAFRVEQFDTVGWRCTWRCTQARFRVSNLGDRNPTQYNEPQGELIGMTDVDYDERDDA